MLDRITIETANGSEELSVCRRGRTAITLIDDAGNRYTIMVLPESSTLTRFTRTAEKDILDGWPDKVDITMVEPDCR